MFDQCRDAFTTRSGWNKARELAYGSLTCMGRHTLTGMLTSSGKQFMDWSSAYRLFSMQRLDTDSLFNTVRGELLQQLPERLAIVAHMDDTILKKTGRFIPGASWRRDPLGPPFQTNLIWGQRFLQISMALPDHQGSGPSRAVPVDFHHCPSAKKPGKKAGEQDKVYFREQQKQLKLSRQGCLRLTQLRNSLDHQDNEKKQLIVSVDGSYTNTEVLRNLPDRTTLIGRVRKDTKLYGLPQEQPAKGRKRGYGERLPTPEQIRQSDQYPWIQVKAWAAGKEHDFKVKVIKPVLWRSAGEKQHLQLVVIKPLAYRLTKSSPVLYRDPAYLICTDPELDIQQLLQDYLWRWEIEVNLREEKTLLGCGQAQVRHPDSAQRVPAFIAAMYAFLLLAAYRSLKSSKQKMLPRPKWYLKKNDRRHSTGDLINNFRAQLWSKAIGMNFSGFVNQEIKSQSRRNKTNTYTSAAFYLRN
ncbi:MAG: transposase [Bacteroidota bacterium]